MEKRTVLVLGAGSSVDFNLPTGDGLAADIAERVNFYFNDSSSMVRGSRPIYGAAKERHPLGNEVLLAGRRIASGISLSRSIDDFLYNQGEDQSVVTIGKAAIVESVLFRERKSGSLRNLEQPSSDDHDSAWAELRKTWLGQLFAFLQARVRDSELERIFDNISIINFNYDRCVETFLYYALQRAYGVGPERAVSVMSRLRIKHPYGQVGALPWQKTGLPVVQFGQDGGVDQLLKIADQIKTFTEQTHSEEEKTEWREMLNIAQQVVFLGFGFHRQNMELLTVPGPPNPMPRVLATSWGASDADEDLFENIIYSTFRSQRPLPIRSAGPVLVESKTCSEMIRDHGLSLTY